MLRLGCQPTPEQLALACASHAGTPRHVAVVRSILADAGPRRARAAATRRTCRSTRPAAEAVIAAGGDQASLLMNCSGKHAAMVASCVAERLADRRLPRPDAPAPGADHRTRRRAGGRRRPHRCRRVWRSGARHVDGRGLAVAFRPAGDGSRTPVWSAMNAHPALVGGERDVRRPVWSAQLPG